mmetsp:Transcript_45190/g.107555  ORF Transcript_45190/g.107555 Transcript_45190/m.107555 type:complete len:284 (-) Transcript_45190:923-1774(-)
MMHTMMETSNLIQQLLYIQSGGLTLHCHAALHKHVNVHLFRLIRISNNIEEKLHIVHLQPHGCHIGHHRLILHLPLELLHADGSCLVKIQALTKMPKLLSLPHKGLPMSQDQLLAVRRGGGHSFLNKDTCEDIEESKDKEEGEEQEQRGVEWARSLYDRVVTNPIIASCDSHVQRLHAQRNTPEVLIQWIQEICGQVVASFPTKRRKPLGENQGEDIDHEEEHDEGPPQGGEAPAKALQNLSEFVENAHHAQRPKNFGQFANSENTHEPDILALGDGVDECQE